MIDEVATKAIHVGRSPASQVTATSWCPFTSRRTFARRGVEKPRGGYEYTRTANRQDALELRSRLSKNRSTLSRSPRGYSRGDPCALSTEKGDHVAAFDDLYGGTRRLFSQTLANFGLDFTYVDAREARRRSTVSRRTKMIWLESPTNRS